MWIDTALGTLVAAVTWWYKSDNLKKRITEGRAWRLNRKFIAYRRDELVKLYHGEHVLSRDVPYADWIRFFGSYSNSRDPESVSFTREPGLFTVEKRFREHAAEAFDAFQKLGRITADDPVVRLARVQDDGRSVSLAVQETRYSTQVGTNLTVDFKSAALKRIGGATNLRKIEASLGGPEGQLPDLRVSKLANTLGVAAILAYRDRMGRMRCVLPRRRSNVAVFQDQRSCSASRALRWEELNEQSNLKRMVRDALMPDLRSLGQRGENLDITPLALARELGRAGKPQLFAICTSSLEEDDFRQALGAALTTQSKFRLEDVDSILLRVDDWEALYHHNGMSPEVAANALYVRDWLETLDGPSAVSAT
jgi:hypothetical protein